MRTLPAGVDRGTVSRPCWIALRSVSSLRPSCSATSLGLRPSPQQLLCLGRDLRRHHRSTACRTRRVERVHAAGAIRVDATNDAVLRDAEGPHDIHLAAHALADQLGGKHPKGAAVVLGVLKHRLNTAEVCPLAIFADDADYVADPSGPVGDQR